MSVTETAASSAVKQWQRAYRNLGFHIRQEKIGSSSGTNKVRNVVDVYNGKTINQEKFLATVDITPVADFYKKKNPNITCSLKPAPENKNDIDFVDQADKIADKAFHNLVDNDPKIRYSIATVAVNNHMLENKLFPKDTPVPESILTQYNKNITESLGRIRQDISYEARTSSPFSLLRVYGGERLPGNGHIESNGSVWVTDKAQQKSVKAPHIAISQEGFIQKAIAEDRLIIRDRAGAGNVLSESGMLKISDKSRVEKFSSNNNVCVSAKNGSIGSIETSGNSVTLIGPASVRDITFKKEKGAVFILKNKEGESASIAPESIKNGKLNVIPAP